MHRAAVDKKLLIDCTAVLRDTRRVSIVDRGGWGGAYSFVACLSHLTIDHASLSRRSTVPTPNRDTSNIWALMTLLPYTT